MGEEEGRGGGTRVTWEAGHGGGWQAGHGTRGCSCSQRLKEAGEKAGLGRGRCSPCHLHGNLWGSSGEEPRSSWACHQKWAPQEGACLGPAFTSAEDILCLPFLCRTRVEVFCWERKGGMVGVGSTIRDLRRLKDFWNNPWEDWGRDLIRGTQGNCQAASRTCFRLADVSSGPWARWVKVVIFCVHPSPPIPWAECVATGRALHQDIAMWVCPARHRGRVIRCSSRGWPQHVHLPNACGWRTEGQGSMECYQERWSMN